jgi:Uma2 family endonuclease
MSTSRARRPRLSRSAAPDDETYAKLGFYAELGVPEVWIIDRDSKEPEIHVLQAGRFTKTAADADGWVQSALTGIELCAACRG